MNRIAIAILLVLLVGISSTSSHTQSNPTKPCAPSATSSDSTTQEIKDILEEFVSIGIPGIQLAVYKAGNWQMVSAGYADREYRIPMGDCHLQYLQSIAKLYMATAILQWAEKGLLVLDNTIDQYLSPSVLGFIPRAQEITIRMLLNHTSGIPEYNMTSAYVNQLLTDPSFPFQLEDYVRYSYNGKLDSEPGEKFAYRNTNYVLLALIGDSISGDHRKYFRKEIFGKVGLANTYYTLQTDPEVYPNLVKSYWDQEQNGQLVNATELQLLNVAALAGDDGIITTPKEAILFLKALFEHHLISEKSLQEMMQWQFNEKGEPAYGLGLDHAEFASERAYGHSGGGIGAGSQLYYFPDQDVYVFTAINLGTVTYSPIHEQAVDLIEKLYAKILYEK